MSNEHYAQLKGTGRQQPVFEGLQVQAELHENLAVTTCAQTYRNTGSANIETVYTFPLPLDAVLLEMEVKLGDKILKGTVLPKLEAEKQYEEAITDGDAPAMLQNNQPGIYTMNIGNLLSGETARITIRYGMFLRWQGDTLRYHLPTTIAPRYGSAERAGLEAHQEPETSILAENLYAFELKVCGVLAGMLIESPNHEIRVARTVTGEESTVGLVHNTAFMDRDLIVSIRNTVNQTATARLEKDGDEYLLWASFQPQFKLPEDQHPRSVKIVVDCSGSMAGDSIAQAREALLRVLDELRPQDWFNIIAFGSTATPLFCAQAQATEESLAFARGYLNKLDADMGGTEIGDAVEMALRLRCPKKIQQDILLITDGEVWEWEKVVAKAQKAHHRFFTVGVGSSVAEAFVRTLAERTGGACELVSPNENMAERIHRHFKRISTPCSNGYQVLWPMQPVRTFPVKVQSIYDGDTCNLFAWFVEPPSGEVRLHMTLPDASTQVLTATVESSTVSESHDDSIPRMVAALRLREIIDMKEGQGLAVSYQLVSKWTNYLAIIVRNEDGKADTLPKLHTVQQMQAAGSHGMGLMSNLSAGAGFGNVIGFMSLPLYEDRFGAVQSIFKKTRNKVSDLCGEQAYKLKEFSREPGSATAIPTFMIYPKVRNEMDQFVKLLDEVLCDGTMPGSINLPLLPLVMAELLGKMVEEGINEQVVVTLFLQTLADSTVGNGLSRRAKRVIAKSYKQLHIDSETVKLVRKQLFWFEGKTGQE